MSKIESIKNHVREHKKVYVCTGVSLGVGIAIGFGVSRNTMPAMVNVRPIQALNYKSTQTVEVVVEALGDPGNIVQDLTTGTIYASQNQAAKALGAYPADVSRHLKGLSNSVKGHKLAKLGKACVPQVGAEAIA